MKFLLSVQLSAGILAAGLSAQAGEGLNPYKGRQLRAEKFEFAAKPELKKQGGKYVISFASKAACDATVAIVNPKGKIVRHLASGVLGKNAPRPFKQGSLSQSIEWDGKDDLGKPAPSGCRVRVSLGLKANLDRFLGWSRKAMPVKSVAGIACGPGGEVFVLTEAHEGSGLQSTTLNLYVFGRDGSYLRRLLPPANHLPPGKSTVFRWLKTTWGTNVPWRAHSYIMHSVVRNQRWANVSKQTPVVTPNGKFVFLVPDDLGGKTYSLAQVDIKDGSTPPGSIVKVKFEGGSPGRETLHMAASPDGKWLYIGGGSDHYSKGSWTHAVWRMSMATPGKAKLFLGKHRKPGKGDKEFNRPGGVACDKAGNLYVADSGNNRLQVFKPDGSLLKSIPAKSPQKVAVSHRSGEIYLMQDAAKTLVVLGGLADPAVKAEMNAHGSTRHTTYIPRMALDDGPEPSIWLAHCSLGGLGSVRRFERKGGKLVAAAAPGVHAPKGWRKWGPWTPSPYVVADPFREELYIRRSGMCYAGQGMRVDGRTGKVIENFEFRIGKRWMNAENHGVFEECVVGRDGLVYMRLTDNGNWIAPYDPDKREFLKRPGYKHAARLVMNGKKVWGFRAPHAATGFNFCYPMGIAPNGDLYVPCRPNEKAEWAGFKGWHNGDKKRNQVFRELRVYSPGGKLKCQNALPGLGVTDGVRIGRSGDVYMVMSCQPRNMKVPDGIAGKGFPRVWGTLVKFDGAFGRYPIGRVVVDEAKGAYRWGRLGPGRDVRIEGVVWDYGGVGPAPFGHCHCWKSTFDLDPYERVWLPAAPTCTVNVLDANGNIVTRLGGYGNPDSMGKDSPVIDPKTGKLRPRRKDDPEDLKSPLLEPDLGFLDPRFVAVTDEALYVHDSGNERITRAKLGYHAEETVALSSASASAPVRTSPAPNPPETAAVSAAPTGASPLPAPAGGKASAGKPAAAGAGGRPAAENKQIAMARKCKHWMNMAKNYASAGMSGKAREYLRKVISGYPQSSFADSARKRLETIR